MQIKQFKPYLIFISASLFALSLSRIILITWQIDRLPEWQNFIYILIQGVRFDFVLMGLVIIIPASLTPYASINKKISLIWFKLVNMYLVIIFSLIIFIELTTPSFINQYDLRPNYLYVEYLRYPKEVFSTLWSAYKLPLFFVIFITITGSFALFYKLNKAYYAASKNSIFKSFFISFAVLVICISTIRSTYDHRPVNPSTVAFSSDPLINMLALSSAYSVLYAIYEFNQEDRSRFSYGTISELQAVNIVKDEMNIDSDNFLNTNIPTLHYQKAFIKRKKPLNLVIILEESLGAEYVGALGGKKLTPELDKLSSQGIWFNNMYATGTRSVRGIEAIITGFTPTPARSVVKLGKSQVNFFTLAELLSRHNYKTSFIYGGESHFDNMKRFFANNGFNKIIDENDYDNPVFYGSWGVSDEDLFNRAHKEFESYKKNQPFFSLIFTSSNHSPFDYPEGRIKIEGKNRKTVDNAVKYADYALGKFIKNARQSDYWNNTLFVIIADHSDKVYGTAPVPVRHFQIPALIIGKSISPTLYQPVASQIDILPTMLSLMGVDSINPAIGHDLSPSIMEQNTSYTGRAIMQFGDSQAYMEGKNVVILQKNKPASEYIYENNTLINSHKIHPKLREKALAHAAWATTTYRKLKYRLDNVTVKNTPYSIVYN
ncbi:Phosphatidylglycerol--membrane-oligosaccharide glycerophosphotransferase [hydrothermal vent metagenome]|uniref:Phosphatidylglycerol--membrane-oligosaccharide glycerophosphotransferase n=1 Tax=hydrothermal vent metagenome TaxID=652676 RepID=A0A3B0Y4K3_9ZZZZ